jgi:signal transduction histidine kinase
LHSELQRRRLGIEEAAMTTIDISAPVFHETSQERIYGPHLVGGWRTAGRTAWLLIWLLSLSVFFAAIVLWYQWDSTPVAVSALSQPEMTTDARIFLEEYQQAIRDSGMSLPFYAGLYAALRLVSGIPFFILSVLIVRRRSDRLMAILFAIVLAVMGAAGRWIFPNWTPLEQFSWTVSLIRLLFFVLESSVILAYTFPDGRFIPRWTRWLALAALLFSFARHFLTETVLNPDHLPWSLGEYSSRIFLLVGLFAMMVRYWRYANAVQKQQIKWITAGALLLGFFYFAHYLIYMTPLFEQWTAAWTPREILISQMIQEPGWYIAQSLLAVAIGLALFRYRLWDIDLVFNRLLVYGSLTLLTMGAYLLTVAALGSLFAQVADTVVFFLATGFVAIVFEPLRRRLQGLVNRFMYGERDDPYAVLTRLGNTLEHATIPDEMLPAIAVTIGQALKIPYVAIFIQHSGVEQVAAVYGKRQPDLLSFPLIYQTETIGSMQIALRARGEEFSNADRRLIENIARQAGAAAHAVRLHAQIVHSRTEIVTAREEERRRLRRDLHDGLGPILASQTLKMAAVRQLVRQNPDRAEVIVDEVIARNENTISEVRRLVYGLRPPALDVLGLVEAVRDLTRSEAQVELSASQIMIEVVGPQEGLPELPAAVEVNAYRITLEALTNAVRHSQARRCTIRFQSEKYEQNSRNERALLIQINDDGMGVPYQYQAGVGMRSMRERAEELGGTLEITPVHPHGTLVSARLPFADGE